MKISLFTLIALTLLPAPLLSAWMPEPAARVVPIGEFIRTAVKNDESFESILTGELALKYKRGLALPPKDLVLSVRAQHEFFLSQDRSEPGVAVSLSRLFPMTGTGLTAEYSATPYPSSEGVYSGLAFYVSQPIASNAFGRNTRILDELTGAEIDLARYQITEAYEDYLASVMAVYYNWYLAFENRKIASSAYEQSLKLLENIKNRQKSNIALPIDVNKVRIQVLGKKENLIALEKEYAERLNLVKQSLRYSGSEELRPSDPFSFGREAAAFDKEYAVFKSSSRTCAVLDLLEKKSSLSLSKYSDDLLPSADLKLGYEADGGDFGLKRTESSMFFGLSLTWLFSDQAGRAAHETAKVTERTQRLSNRSKRAELAALLKNLHLQLQREKELIDTADEKIGLSRLILEDETVNYSYGKVSLNDLIDAANRIDDNNFNKLAHLVKHKLLFTEWQRLTDTLVTRTPPPAGKR